ncbi:hypothetical protein HYW41_05235 [Candidatus Daviesbacteria bacterium]|nr:hypothetical protein [Candidatus Daviesbacteria bacterium]
MTSQEILNIFLILSLLVVTSCVVYITYYFVKALRSLTNFTNDLERKAGLKILAAIPGALIAIFSGFFKRRG